MRTTVAIDEDVFDKLKDLAAKRRLPFTKIVNEILRRGLTAQRERPTKKEPFRVQAFHAPLRPGIDPLRINQVLDDLEVAHRSVPKR